MTGFDFGPATDFNAGIDDDLLGTEVFQDVEQEYPSSQDYGDEPVAPAEASMTAHEAAEQVEDTFLDLMEQGRHADIAALTGADVTAHIASDVMDEFRPLYAKAVTANPALKWYAKLASILPREAFTATAEGLHLAMKPTAFRAALQPFMADFREELEADSPLVATVRSLYATFNASSTEATLNRALETRGKQNIEAGQFTVHDAEFDNPLRDAYNDETPDFLTEADMALDDDIFGNPQQTMDEPKTAKLSISLADLSNKAVADYLNENGGDCYDTLSNHLAEQGFSKARANQIVSIVRYQRLNKALNHGPEGNRGGDVDFNFR